MALPNDDVVTAQIVGQTQLEQTPVKWREVLSVLLLVGVSDIAVYRGHGFSGLAVLFAISPLLLLFGAPKGRTIPGGRRTKSLWMVTVLLSAVAMKMAWSGSALLVVVGLFLLIAFASALSGLVPYALEVIVFPSRMILGGLLGLAHYCQSVRRPNWRTSPIGWWSVVLPLVTLVAFGLLFVLANPDLLTFFGRRVELLLTSFREWLVRFAPHPTEFAFWGFAAWICVGLLRPLLKGPLLEDTASQKRVTAAPAAFYAACRNTLITVIALFALYLAFEFKTLWFREFPEGFYYSGYAHQGAAWLTVALALATAILSLVFRGAVLNDPGVGKLRRLAWVWSFENVLLAVAVYNRLSIYVGFNGMTRMRIVGFFGISAVLIGFLLVVWKIARNRGFVWLIRRHLWTLALAIYLFAVTPVDWIVVSYNVRRILSGHLAPSVQITEHDIDSEGILLLQPLLEYENDLIRDGVQALLAERHEQLATIANTRRAEGWTSFQFADHRVLRHLSETIAQWDRFEDRESRDAAWQSFREYAYQWY